MYTKYLKQKLLRRRPWIGVVATVFTLSMLSAVFGSMFRLDVSLPNSLASNDTGISVYSNKAYAKPMPPRAEIGNKAVEYCKNNRTPAAFIDSCQEGYVYGYSMLAPIEQACPANKDNGKPYSQDQCKIAYQAGERHRTRDGVTTKENGEPIGQRQPTEEERKVAQLACKDLDGEAKSGCEQGFLGAAWGQDKARACRGTSGAKKAACERKFDERKGELDNGERGEDKKEAQVDCDATGAILSWIICPVIDLGTGLTDFVFEDIVRPLLEDVPVSTNPDDGSYKAWSSFRLLANILLVGSLLAIVYSQAKGGGK